MSTCRSAGFENIVASRPTVEHQKIRFMSKKIIPRDHSGPGMVFQSFHSPMSPWDGSLTSHPPSLPRHSLSPLRWSSWRCRPETNHSSLSRDTSHRTKLCKTPSENTTAEPGLCEKDGRLQPSKSLTPPSSHPFSKERLLEALPKPGCMGSASWLLLLPFLGSYSV